MIAFTKSKLPFGWLGNMSPFPIIEDGVEWRTCEALFQAKRFADQEIREKIRSARSPMTAKIIAKQNAEKMIVEPCSAQDLENMKVCIRLKLDRHPDLAKALEETGEEIIVEDVTARGAGGRNLFWGMLNRQGVWEGENTLGKLWMEIRAERRIQNLVEEKRNSYSDSTNQIVANVLRSVEQKREEGWKKEDFAAKLKTMLESPTGDDNAS